MKKIVYIMITIITLASYSKLIAADNFTLSAVVGNSNHAPIVTEVSPNSNPRYLDNSTDSVLVKQNYSIKFRDDENDEVTYTITTQASGGAVNPTSGTVLTGDYDGNDEAYITFEYITPTTAVGAKTITVTITDGPNVTTETINVYIY